MFSKSTNKIVLILIQKNYILKIKNKLYSNAYNNFYCYKKYIIFNLSFLSCVFIDCVSTITKLLVICYIIFRKSFMKLKVKTQLY